MSQLASLGSGRPDEPASIERLPPEILLPIVSSLPGLDALWNLMRASPNTFRLFNNHAIAITEGILSGPNSIMPSKAQGLVRGVILARSEVLPFKSLHEFRARFLCEIFNVLVGNNQWSMFLGPGTLSVSNLPIAAVRSVVATSYQIAALSQACLASCLERLRAIKVSHPVNPMICYTDDYDRPGEMFRAFERVYPGAPAKMVDSGNPRWLEEMRAVRAIWAIQMVGEMRRLSANKANMIDWTDEDIESLKRMDLVDFFRIFRRNYSGEEMRTAMEYLTTLGEATNDVYYRLPRPPPATPATRWTTALPIPDDREIYRLGLDPPRPVGDEPIEIPYNENHIWGRSGTALSYDSFGVEFFRDLTGATDGPRESPIPGVKFDSFRPLGFAFWDLWRMYYMGLAPPHPCDMRDRYYFAWESILPPEEVESIKKELQADWKRTLDLYNGGSRVLRRRT